MRPTPAQVRPTAPVRLPPRPTVHGAARPARPHAAASRTLSATFTVNRYDGLSSPPASSASRTSKPRPRSGTQAKDIKQFGMTGGPGRVRQGAEGSKVTVDGRTGRHHARQQHRRCAGAGRAHTLRVELQFDAGCPREHVALASQRGLSTGPAAGITARADDDAHRVGRTKKSCRTNSPAIQDLLSPRRHHDRSCTHAPAARPHPTTTSHVGAARSSVLPRAPTAGRSPEQPGGRHHLTVARASPC